MGKPRIDRSSASRRNRFSSVRLDRLTEYRDDRNWQRQKLTHPDTRLVPLWRSRCMLQPDQQGAFKALLLTTGEIEPLDAIRPPTLLGSDGQHVYFAVTINDQQREQLLDVYPVAEFSDLRMAARNMHGPQAGILAYAKALHYWQHRHTFCGVCGSPNQLRSGGHKMTCSNDECGRETFPRIDPAIIVLVTHGDACLLGRNARWPARRFSTLAGFVEPGESLEDAVAREVFEETRVRLKAIRYRSSQPWPFPSSAMAGFYAEASSREFSVDDDELEEARWLTAAQLKAQLQANEIRVSPPMSIAFQLIAGWYQEQCGENLEQLIQTLRGRRRQAQ